jgi:hypothetical protein
MRGGGLPRLAAPGVRILDRSGLPITGVERGQNVFDRSARPMYELLGEHS